MNGRHSVTLDLRRLGPCTVMWATLLLLISTALYSCPAAAQCTQLFVRLGDSSAVDSPGCGSEASSPCATVTRAVSNGAVSGNGTAECTEVSLLSSAYNAPIACEALSSVQGVTVSGSEAGTIPLHLLETCMSNRGHRQTSWLFLWNCSDVSFRSLSVSMLDYTGFSALDIIYSYNVSVLHSVFMYPTINVSAVYAENCLMTLVSGCQFSGSHVADPFYNPDGGTLYENYRLHAVAAFQYGTLGPLCADNASISDDLPPCSFNIPADSRLIEPYSYTMAVRDCSFLNLGIQNGKDLYYISTRYANGVAIMAGGSGVLGFQVLVSGCNFTNLHSPYDTPLKLFVQDYGSSGAFQVTDCTFLHGRAYIGGALFIRIAAMTSNTSLLVQRTVFRNNTASVAGGAIAMSFEGVGDEDWTHPDYPNPEKAMSIESCVFEGNAADSLSKTASGGAISALFNGTSRKRTQQTLSLPLVKISKSYFSWHTANFASVLIASKIHIELEETTINSSSGDSAFSISNSQLIIGDKVTFLNNMADNQGGAVALYDFSLVRIVENANVKFINNSAPYRGGAIFADTSSSTIDIADLLQYKSAVGLSKPCFLQTVADFSYGNSSRNDTSRIVFEGNRAYSGSAIFANSYTPCLYQGSRFLGGVHEQKEKIGPVSSAELSSGAVWFTMASIGCDCLKKIPSKDAQYWLYHRSCDRTSIYQDAHNNSLYMEENYLDLFNNYTRRGLKVFRSSVDTNGYGVFASNETFVLPWSLSTYEWFYPRNIVQEAATRAPPPPPSPELAEQIRQTYVSSATLYPAPGETFPLKFQLADIYFNEVYELAKIKVSSGNALLIQDGTIVPYTDPVLFCTSTTLYIGLVGRPGERGTVTVTAAGQLSSTPLQLVIPYRLRPCHIGFRETPAMRKNTTEEIKQYILSLPRTKVTGVPGSRGEELICQCPKSDNVPGIQSCVDGSDIRMSWFYWAGVDNARSTISRPERMELVTNLSEHETTIRNMKLLTSECYGGFCTEHSMQNWLLHQESPCLESRDGLICGKCAEGFERAIAWNPICVRCSDSYDLTGKLYFLVTFIVTGVILFFFSYFEVGKSAIFDSWVGFEQTILFTVRRDAILHTVTNSGYFSCLSSSVMAVTARFYFVTLSFFIWLLLVFQLSRFVVVRRFVQNHSLVVGLWASLTFCYAFVLYPSFSILGCHTFNGNQVLYGDASIQCFGSEHLPWGLLALFSLLFVAVPVPFILVFMRSHPKIKPLVDVYLSFVRDQRYWYIAYGLTRRIIVCILSVYLADTTIRQVTLALLMLFFFFLHCLIQPYRRPSDNVWEALFLGFACAFAVVSIVPQTSGTLAVTACYISYAIPVVCAFCYGLFKERRRLLALLEVCVTVLLFPVLVIYYHINDLKFKRISLYPKKYRNKKEISSNGEPLMGTNSTKEHQRAKEVYELRDDILSEVFQPQ